MANFRAPYLSKKMAELWRRWHISLSSWFRDYLYIPLGGNRCPKPRKYLNNFITFSVSGLWHGANWTYVVWGAMQSIYIIIGDLLKPLTDGINSRLNVKTDSAGYKLVQISRTFSLYALSMIVFRSATLKDALYYIQRLFTTFDV